MMGRFLEIMGFDQVALLAMNSDFVTQGDSSSAEEAGCCLLRSLFVPLPRLAASTTASTRHNQPERWAKPPQTLASFGLRESQDYPKQTCIT